MNDRVNISINGGIADVRLNRPDNITPLDPAMFAAVVEAGESLKADPSVRAVVLSGEGRGFCAGLDFSSFQAMAGGGAPKEESPREQEAAPAGVGGSIMDTGDRMTHLGQQAAWVWQELDVPVIAALHGPALGGGLQIALGPDIRTVAPDAKPSVLEARWGMITDITGTAILTTPASIQRAQDLKSSSTEERMVGNRSFRT